MNDSESNFGDDTQAFVGNFKSITLSQPVRALKKIALSATTLSNEEMKVYRPGQTLCIGQHERMFYNHGFQTVVEVLDEIPQRFIIVNELELDPWAE